MALVNVPVEFTRVGNTDHRGSALPIADDEVFAYGTAGFRYHSSLLPFIAFRVGYLASLRARVMNSRVGVMITASHNPEDDNGLKIVDPDGEMLDQSWEEHATNLINATDFEFPTVYRAFETQFVLEPETPTNHAYVYIGMDTRESSPYLLRAVRLGVELGDTTAITFGQLTTPQLHFLVARSNIVGKKVDEKQYYIEFSKAFKELCELLPDRSANDHHIFIDCAAGVGAPKMRELMMHIPESLFSVTLINETGRLNSQCGADYVKIERNVPANSEKIPDGAKAASFDGDADRLVYFYKNNGKCRILDGDKIACLFAKFLGEHLRAVNLYEQLSIGIVQTAYANGNSMNHIKETLQMPVVLVPTGVKHLHKEAKNYDIGVYFEANGHGTVIFSSKFHKKIESAEQTPAILRLRKFAALINFAVGDAITDMLATEAVLRYYDWSVENWDNELYEDAPSCQLKVPTIKDETRLTAPEELQDAIDELVKTNKCGRAFARPSGTENIVRVYAEGNTEENAKELAHSIAKRISSVLS
uniref:Phosphoacetylglucosamine mutase n=1 Tax=Steinernema glaseri TaxID=37863 RepID=A0A1I8AFN6_9BILA